jgi:hypothetical protein
MKSLMVAAALLAGGFILTGALASVLQARAVARNTVDMTYRPDADAMTDRWGWPVPPKTIEPLPESGPPASWDSQA